ncbi:hypothetical protein MT325_m060L [Paramecium bursaria chlorella virus MT325]|uniref:Uncharacterized protein m060L n=1 Tax=Paramecium bursaria Chlorella virus MT325 TaxID=346932 RepID=A7ITE0_PBCVM|nr:hypothetical protein MT325_m060L [Paramecium bursaria chlorella virus MT325]
MIIQYDLHIKCVIPVCDHQYLHVAYLLASHLGESDNVIHVVSSRSIKYSGRCRSGCGYRIASINNWHLTSEVAHCH